MINKIKKQLIVKYTLILTLLLTVVTFGSYFVHRLIVNDAMNDALLDYLNEEVWEAERHAGKTPTEAEFNKINSDVNSIHTFTYWFFGNRLVHAEEPINEEVSFLLQKRMRGNSYQERKIYFENIKHNKTKWYFLLAMQNISINGKIAGKVFVLTNVSPLKKSNKRYVANALLIILLLSALSCLVSNFLAGRAVEQINKFFEKQKRFVSDASHEFRTPLSILLSYTELLELKTGSSEIIKSMKDEILGMSELSGRLLELARSDNDQFELKCEDINLTEIILTLTESLKLSAPDKNITAAAAPDLKICGDRSLLKQLLYILTDNAVKYTAENGCIEISAAAEAENIKITVKDNGLGISEEDRRHIFERFYRAEKSRNRNKGGLGLGLSLAEIIVRHHGGTISVESAEGKGSRFTVILPKAYSC